MPFNIILYYKTKLQNIKSVVENSDNLNHKFHVKFRKTGKIYK